MATVDIADILLGRSGPAPPSATVDIADIQITLTEAEPTGATVDVSAIWITRGYTPPITDGGVWFRTSPGVWGRHNTRVRVSPGVWG